MSASIRFFLLNDFSSYQNEIFRGLEQAGLIPEGYAPEDRDDFLVSLAGQEPDLILITAGVSEDNRGFHIYQVLDWLAEQKSSVPVWMIVRPEDEGTAVEAMYAGMADYFFTDRLSRLPPLAIRLIGRKKQTLEPLHLNLVLEEIIEAYRPVFHANNLSLSYLPGADLPPFLGEPALLSQALSSLLEKIGEAAPPETKVDLRSYLDAVKGEVCLETKLSGEGLQTEQQIEATAVSEPTLRLTREIVGTQNGRFEIDTGEEFGIRICISFPAILPQQLEGSPKLLIVENSLLMRSILQEALEQEGFIIKTAENGAAAIEILADFQPDLIISDIVMPVMDGFAFFESVREKPDWQGIPFIFVTGQSEQREHLNTQALRGATYLLKPIIIEELLVAIRTRLL